MGLFGRGPERVVERGAPTTGRIVAIRVSEASVDDSRVEVHEYVVAVGSHGRRAAIRQHLTPENRVRLGMPVRVFERGDDVVIDWQATMADQGHGGDTLTHGWKMVKDWGGDGITDTSNGRQKAADKGAVGTASIEDISVQRHFGGLATSTTITVRVDLPGDEPYELELPKQAVPHYASHLAVVGTELRCFVDPKRLDRVTLDWANAAERDPGVGADPVEAEAPDEAPTDPGGSLSADGRWDVDAPSDLDSPPPIEGVSWQQYLAVSVAIERDRIKPKEWDAYAQSKGIPAGRWGQISQAWAMQMARSPELQRSYAAARQ